MELEDRLYSSSEVARILSVSRRTLYRYLESGTLGSMHLPSGRHRFTKDQVEAFLVKTYGASNVKSTPKVSTEKIEQKEEIKVEVKEEVTKKPSIFSKIEAVVKTTEIEKVQEIENEVEEEEEELIETPEVEEIIEPEEVEEETEEIEDEEVDEVVEDLKKTLSSLFDDEEEKEEVKPEKKGKDTFTFYSSSITDLKKLAKTVKVASENSNVQYAFTGQAGASLYGEVSPFGQLHLYIRKNDMLFFEKRFDLAEIVEDDSNVALKVVDELPEHTIVMGFKVVSLPLLKKDLIQLGDTSTAQNLEG